MRYCNLPSPHVCYDSALLETKEDLGEDFSNASIALTLNNEKYFSEEGQISLQCFYLIVWNSEGKLGV